MFSSSLLMSRSPATFALAFFAAFDPFSLWESSFIDFPRMDFKSHNLKEIKGISVVINCVTFDIDVEEQGAPHPVQTQACCR